LEGAIFRVREFLCKVGLNGHYVVICAKTAELTGMLFGLWACVGPRNYVFDESPDPSTRKCIFWGKGRPIAKYRDFLP